MPFLLNRRRGIEIEDTEQHPHAWQKIVNPLNDELEQETGHPGWIRKYLDLADLLIKRAQRRWERTAVRRKQDERNAA